MHILLNLESFYYPKFEICLTFNLTTTSAICKQIFINNKSTDKLSIRSNKVLK